MTIEHATDWLDTRRPQPGLDEYARTANEYAAYIGTLETMVETLYAIAMRSPDEADRSIAHAMFKEEQK